MERKTIGSGHQAYDFLLHFINTGNTTYLIAELTKPKQLHVPIASIAFKTSDSKYKSPPPHYYRSPQTVLSPPGPS